MAQASKKVKEKTAHINAEIESSLSGIRTAKAFANEEVEGNRFNAANGIFRDSKREFHKAMGHFHSSMEFFLCSLNVIVIGIGGYLIMKNQMDYRDLITFTLYIASFVSPMRKLSNFSELFANGFAGLNRFVSIMRTEPTIQDAPDAVDQQEVKGSIRVEDVSFAYTPEVGVLHHVNLEVQPGQRIAIVGPTGCGKTTFINLLMRFYDAQEGEIVLDGVNTRDMSRGQLRRSVGMVLQDTWLKAGTIRENIAMGRPDATIDEIIAAAKQAHAHSFIKRLPKGYDTVIGESGGNLSQGQKQLLCIARVMLCLPPMLILDEATSSIDTRTEIKIQKAFNTMMQGRTSFIVAHRLSTIREADVILVMRDGQIVEQGNHESLLAKNGFYAQLYQSQFAH
jgi:ATP-binding cassette subfamily B protein